MSTRDLFRAVILAAGKSKRMKSQVSKIMHDVLGKPIIQYVVEAVQIPAVEEILVVVGPHNHEAVREVLKDTVRYVVQKEQLGTGHALLVCEEALKHFHGQLLVLVGDAPFLTRHVMEQLITYHQSHPEVAATLLTAVYDTPPPYGRVVRNANGKVLRIVEDKDADAETKKIKEVSTSHYAFDKDTVFPLLKEIRNDNAQGEYYLPDVIGLLIQQGHAVAALPVDDPFTTFGINTRRDLVKGIAEMRRRIIDKWLDAGVTILDPKTTFIDTTVEIGADTIIYPFTHLEKGTRIGSGCRIGPFVYLSQAHISDGEEIIGRVKK